ncbi:PQQ-binding-like beta-propeller repeat protein [Candidatus Poribacteria bacterium]|nr:PQQ-binding-like beta-propeller repeat protein [Candidatus Poribacteria bacterium]
MGTKDHGAGGRDHVRPRRKLPCVNHPKTPAAARCQVCGNPICSQCLTSYEGAQICSSQCWNARVTSESATAATEEKARRRKKEKVADRAVTIVLLSAFIIIVAVAGIFAYVKLSNHAGEKIWEYSDSAGYLSFSIQPDSNTLFLLSRDKLEAIHSLTGRSTWSVKLPERVSSPRIFIIDDDRCLLSLKNKVLLCGSAQATPMWVYSAPQPFMSARPVFFDNRLYSASSAGGYPTFYSGEDSDYFDRDYYYLEEDFDSEEGEDLSVSWRKRSQGQDKEEKKASTVSSVDMTSGAQLWKTELEDRRVGGLMADKDYVYVVAYDFDDDLRSRYRLQAEDTKSGAEQQAGSDEQVGSAQLWALNAATGKAEWKLEGGGGFVIPPMMSGEGIVFSTEKNIYLISASGQIKWTYPIPDKLISSFQPYTDKLFVSTSDGFLFCLDLATGQKKWMTEIGDDPGRIVVSPPLLYVSGLARREEVERKVIPTKRWQGSEDLLKKALKPSGPTYEKILLGIDIESGQTRVSIPKITGNFAHGGGVLYALRYFEWMQFLDASADPTQLSKTVSNLGAYDALSGEKIWETAIEGYASNLSLGKNAVFITARFQEVSLAADQGNKIIPTRLIGISLQ